MTGEHLSGNDLPPPSPAVGARWPRLALGTVLSIIFLILALRSVDLAAVGQALTTADLLPIAVGVVCVTLVNVAKALRWQRLLAPHTRTVGLHRLFAVIMIGQGMNAFAPLRVGDLARAYMVQGVSVASVLYTIMVEKALDSLILLALLLWVALSMPLPEWLKQSGIILSVVLVGVLVVFVLVGRGSSLLLSLAQHLDRIAALRRLSLAGRVAAGAEIVRSLAEPRLLGATIGWSALAWALGGMANYVTFSAVRLQVQQPVVAAVFLLVVGYLGAAVPSSPGKVGVFHYLVILSLALFAVSKASALTYAIILHLVVYGPTAVLGAFYVWRESQQRGRL